MTRVEELGFKEQVDWFFGAADEWPDVFKKTDLAQYLFWACNKTEEDESRAYLLRAGLLKILHKAVGDCTNCPLHSNRLKKRPVLDDCSFDSDPFTEFGDINLPVGAVQSKIMIISEGPGQFEQRTGVPYVSYQVLSGSLCARECSSYEKCYNSKSLFPQQVCKPTSIRGRLKKEGCAPAEIEENLIQIGTERANAPPFRIQTAGAKLDEVLLKAGLWRESWNPRQLRRKDISEDKQARPGSVYLCNIVKCRACTEDPSSLDGLKDRPPTKAEATECRKWLDIQFHIIQPKVIVCLGAAAVEPICNIKQPKILSIRGSMHEGPLGIPAFVDVHPSWIIRQGEGDLSAQHTELLVGTFLAAKKIVAGEVEIPWKLPDIEKDTPYADTIINNAPNLSPSTAFFTSIYGENDDIMMEKEIETEGSE